MKDLKRSILGTCLMVVLGLSSNATFAGGPWLLPQKSGFVQAQAILPAYKYQGLLMGLGLNDVQGVNRKTFNSDYGIYVEYGITNRLNVMTNIPFKYVSTGELTDSLYFNDLLDAGSLAGLGNYGLALKYGIIDKSIKVAVSAQARFNSIRKDENKGLLTGFDGNSFGLVAHVGGSINEKSYAFFEGGFHKYTNNLSDIVEAKLEYGRNLGEAFTLMFTMDIRQSLENGTYSNANFDQVGLYTNDQEWVAISAKINLYRYWR